MHVEKVHIETGGRTLRGELYLPPAALSGEAMPGVVILHELFGLNSNVRADARSIARRGYAVLAPDLYSSVGMSRYCMKMMFTKSALSNPGDSELVSEVHACLDFLKTHTACSGRLGMIGMCLTGGFALQMARRSDVEAPVVYHHAFGVKGSGLPEDEAAEIQHKVLGMFAEGDRVMCPRLRVDALERQLGNRLESHVYPNVAHGLRSAYRYTPESEAAWARTLAFFDEQLRDGQPYVV